MRPSDARPDHDVAVGVDVTHEGGRTRVTRLVVAGSTVIRKEPLGPDAGRRLRHELAVLERLRGVSGVAQLLDEPGLPGSILLEDAGDSRLADLATPLAADGLIELAVRLAVAVAGMHGRGVMHRDITPANVVVSGDGHLCLVDFALATPFAEIRPEFTHHSGVMGTLAYLAPEQTGRTGRAVDQRADLYALGATLYELATGGPPFGSGDQLRLTHDHLTRVPVPPADVNPAVPGPLSAIILHLLEKEPDRRYQTAEGVVYDLERLRDGRRRSAAGAPDVHPIRVGERDVPLRMLPPSRLVSREDEVTALEATFNEALAGRCKGILVSGAPGVGKTALVDRLRPVVTGRDGWFVAGKFDQYRRDLAFDAVNQVFRALGRLLLGEPEDELAQVRERIVGAVGSNVGQLTAAVPEFAVLLGVPPDPGDPLTAQPRAHQAAATVLRAVASRARPLVVFLDDLQWAGRTPLGFVDLVLSEEPTPGLLLVGAYRDSDVDTSNPLAPMLARWRDQGGVKHLRLDNLPASGSVAMVAEMLRVDPPAAAGLAEMIQTDTGGNPYQTVEVLNALRREGALTVSAARWRWDPARVRERLGRSDAAEPAAARVEGLPANSRGLVEAMACLGGRAELTLLQIATGESADEVDQALAPSLDAGVLVAEPGAHEAVRFQHDRIREVILNGLGPAQRRGLHLAMARRLAQDPELSPVASEQYLPVLDAVADAAERGVVVGLLRRAADQAALIGDYARVNTLLTAALPLIDARDTVTLLAVRSARHAVLYSLGSLDEADEEFRTIEGMSRSVLDRAAATAVQVTGLTHRNRLAEAIALSLGSLAELGITVPDADRLPADLDRQFAYLYRWLDDTQAADDLARPEITDQTLLAATRLIDAVLTAAYLVPDVFLLAWLSLEAVRILIEHGPSRTLIGPASIVGFAAMALRGDQAAGYRAMRRLLALGEARGYEPETSRVRVPFALMACWFEPIENGVRVGQRAREGLLAGGDLPNVSYSYYTTVHYMLDCEPSLDTYVAEVEAGVAFARRTGSEQTIQWLDSCRWLVGAMRGNNIVGADQAVPTDRYAGNPVALIHAHLSRAIVAAIFGDPVGLERHSAAAMPLIPANVGNYSTAVAHVLRGLALAQQVRGADGGERGDLLSELDDVTRLLAAHAANAPSNFLHLLRLLEAERTWAVGDFQAAVLAFDMALREATQRQRPWHRALIAERAARFYLAHGVEHVGYDLLAQARQQYAAWGASAKAAQLDWAYPSLQPPPNATGQHPIDQSGELLDRRSLVTTGMIDLLGILSASQALSSETSIDRLQARVAEVLSAMTGATSVHLLLWSEDRHGWLLPAPGGHDGADPIGGSDQQRAVPMSVLRYVQRTGEPLLVGDATVDDRFARDPYLIDVDCCSLLAVPILRRGTLKAVLLLENRLLRGAFSTQRLEAVTLIAGQLAVSLDNAQLYAQLTSSRARIVATTDQTRRRIERDLHDGAQQHLVSLALRLRGARATVAPEAGGLAAELDELADEASSALNELRELARGIHPAALARGGLLPALHTLALRCPVPVAVDVQVDERLPEQTEIATYYVVAEALTNAAKHAEASSVTVAVHTADHLVRVSIRDDGRGGADLGGGTGLVGLKDRVEALGGRILLDSPPQAGTNLRVELPLAAAVSGHSTSR